MKPKKNQDIRAIMSENNLTQVIVAKEMGVSQGHVSYLLRHDLTGEDRAWILGAIDNLINRDPENRNKLRSINTISDFDDIDILGFTLTDVYEDENGALRLVIEEGAEKRDLVLRGEIALSEPY